MLARRVITSLYHLSASTYFFCRRRADQPLLRAALWRDSLPVTYFLCRRYREGAQSESKTRIEAVKPCRMCFNVCLYRKKVFVDEFGSFLILVRFGIQPSAGSSRRGRAEMQQDGRDCSLAAARVLIDVLTPLHAHLSPPGEFSRTRFKLTSWIVRRP